MKSTGERILLAVLALAAGGLYLGGAFAPSKKPFSETASSPEPAVEPDPVVLEVPPAEEIETVELGTLTDEGGEAVNDRGEWRGHPVIADLNGDGHLDLAASIRRWSPSETAQGLFVWLGDGQGGFRLALDGIRRDMGYGGAVAADVDGDERLDLGFSAHDTPPQVFLNRGDGTWEEASSGLISEGVCFDVALGDFDGDGATDMFVLGAFPGKGGLAFFQGDGEGTWELRDELLDVENYGTALETTDIEGDGVLELVAATSTGPRVWSHDGEGFVDRSAGLEPAGLFGPGATPGEDAEEPVQPYIGGSDMDVVPHDFDGDGVQELVVGGMIYDGHPPLRIYKLDAEGVWHEWGEGLPDGEAVWDVSIAQLDGEGPMELVLGSKHGIKIVRVLEPGRFEVAGRLAGTEGVVNVGSGDFDGDGSDEVVFIGFGGIRVLSPRGGIQ